MKENKNSKIKLLIIFSFLFAFILFSLAGFYLGRSFKSINIKVSMEDKLRNISNDNLYIKNNEKLQDNQNDLYRDAVTNMYNEYVNTLIKYDSVFDLLKESKAKFDPLELLGITYPINGLDSIYVYELSQNGWALENGLYPSSRIIGYQQNSINYYFKDFPYNDVNMANAMVLGNFKVIVEKEIHGKIEFLDFDYSKYKNFTNNVVTYKMLNSSKYPGGVGYIKIHSFSEYRAADQIKDAIKEIEKKFTDQEKAVLVIDLKSNPGGYVKVLMPTLSNFLPQPKENKPYVRYNTKNKVYNIEKIEPSDEFKWDLKNLKKYDIKIFVNKDTASLAEVFYQTMYYASNKKYEIIGSQTYGKYTTIGYVDSPYFTSRKLGFDTSQQLMEVLDNNSKYIDPRKGIDITPINGDINDLIHNSIFVYQKFKKDTYHDLIKAIQKTLNYDLNKNIEVSGYFGNETEQLLKEFQTKYIDKLKKLKNDNNYKPNGLYDFETYQLIYEKIKDYETDVLKNPYFYSVR